MLAEFVKASQNSAINHQEIAQSVYLSRKSTALGKYLTASHRLETAPSEESCMAILRARLRSGIPYTFAGPLLLAFNSELTPTLYFNRHIAARYTRMAELPPHLYSTTLVAYNRLAQHRES